MKKIIYSLVIMIAAGSLFTSCVENTEPQGIKDLRLAKADYLDALSNLRAADAEKVKAEAALVQAQAATEQAVAAYNQAIAKAKELANEAQKVQDEVAAEKAKADIDSIKAAAEKAAVVAQQGLAEAQAQLDSALRKITAQSFDLTQDEKDAISDATTNLNEAYNAYNAALNGYNFTAMLLWDAEYNVEAGVEGYETAESFKDSIAARESAIAQAKEHIATVEAIEEEPASVKEALDASAKKIEDLQEEIFLNEKSKTLYEAQVLAEANVEYNKRWNAFQDDSLAGYKPNFEFKGGKYAMNAVYGEHNTNRVDILCAIAADPLKNFGLEYKGKEDGVSKFIMPKADEEKTSKILYGATGEADTLGLVDIVSTLKRDLVLVNGTDSADAAAAVKAAKVADSIYTDHRAILEKGLDSFKVYTLAKDTVKMFQDTVKDAKVADSTAKAKVAADYVAIKDALKAAAKEYIAANKAFVDAVNDIKTSGGIGHISNTDSAAFIKAVQDLGKAQAAYLGYTDSLVFVTVVDGKVNEKNKISIANLEASGFVEKTGTGKHKEQVTSLYGGTGYGWFAGKDAYKVEDDAWYNIDKGKYVDQYNPFSRVALAILRDKNTYDFTTEITEEVVALPSPFKDQDEKYKSTSPVAYGPVSDTVKWGKIVAKGVVAPYVTLADDEKAAAAAEKAVTDAETKLEGKVANIEKAKEEYFDIYGKFFGISKEAAKAEKDTVAKKFAWTAETFEDPYLCVWFEENYTKIADDPTLKLILEAIDPAAVAPGVTSWIFKRDTWTEYALKLQAEQKAFIACNYTEVLDQLANIEEAVNDACNDFEDAYEAWEESVAEYKDVLARFRGVDEDGELLPEVQTITANCVTDDGKWNLGGYQKEWAEELAEAYPAIVKAAQCGELYGQIHRERNFKNQLDRIYTQWFNHFAEQEEIGFAWNVEQIIEKLEDIIEDEEGNIEALEAEIEGFKKAVAACEAGYSPAKAKVDFLKTVLEQKEVALEQAEYALDQAKKVYNAVIENYK